MNLIINRGATIEFSALPARSIALDGYVQGPAIDLVEGKFSFDHHAGCIRLLTRATCQQVLDTVLLGFNPKGYTVYVNDVDGDTALAVWLLRNPSRVTEDQVRRLVEGVGAIDAHGPAYPVIDQDLVDGFFQGVMAPEQNLRRTKKYGEANLEQLLEQCVSNIDTLLDGTLLWTPRTETVREYEITARGTGWVMARSKDFIFDVLYADGFTKAVAYDQLPDGSWQYTVGKKSDLVDGFPVGPHTTCGTILHALNVREAGWGGGTTIGGAPRNSDGSRSRLTPDEVFSIIEGLLK